MLFGQSASAATYYVATNGSDSNPGTPAAPFLTLQKGPIKAVAGDTVIVQDGTYDNAGQVNGGDSSCCNYSAVTCTTPGTRARGSPSRPP